MFGDGQNVARIEPFFLHADIIHFYTITAAQIADKPVATIDGKLAMVGRYVGESQYDVAALSASNQKLFLFERDGVATTLGYEFTVFGIGAVHGWTSQAEQSNKTRA